MDLFAFIVTFQNAERGRCIFLLNFLCGLWGITYCIAEQIYWIMKMENELNNPINKIGFVAGIFAFLFAAAYVVIQMLQMLKILRFPADELLIYGSSLGIVIPFIIAILALHYITAQHKKFWSHAALVFTIIYAVFVTANYVVQLATVLPNKLNGTYEQVKILDQTPHSLFWDFDAIGYIFMGLATLAAIPVFEKQGFQKWVKYSFIANALVTPLITIVYFYPVFSEKLLILGFSWGITAPLAMLMLALLFKRNLKYPEKRKSSLHEQN